jgi:hypothetical protein
VVSSDGTNNTFGNVTNCDFDTYNGISVAAGNLQIAGCGFTLGDPAVSAVVVSGGNVSLSACWFLAAVALTNAIILTSASGGMTLQASACRFDVLVGSTVALNGFTNGLIVLTGCQFTLGQLARTAAAVQVTDTVVLTMNGCRFSAKGGGSGQALNLVADGTHNICGNAFGGWATAAAAGALHIMANNNP